MGLKDYLNFFQYILQKVNIIHFLANDISDALLIYSRLNSGGKVLGHLEIIKGQLFSSIDQSESENGINLIVHGMIFGLNLNIQ